MKSLVRQQFLDLQWDAADLDAAAEFWLRLYDSGKSWRFISRTPQHAVEIRLAGFPSHATKSLREELERRIAASDISNLTVSLADPDTLLLRSEPQTDTPPPGLGLRLLDGSEFDGLLIEVRFRVTGGDRLAIASTPANVSLVLVGEVRRDTLLLKTLWRSPFPEEQDGPFWACPMEEEGELLAGFARFRATGEVSVPLAKEMFGVCENVPWHPEIFEKMTAVPFDAPRLPGLLVRIVAYVGLLVALGFLIWDAHANRAETQFVLCILGAVAVGVVTARFAYKECRLLFGTYHPLRVAVASDSAESIDYVVLTPETSPLGTDPAVRKYTNELTKAGFAPIGDVARPRKGVVASVYRVFSAPDGVSYLTLLCNVAVRGEPGEHMCVWPANILLHAETVFQSGGRIESVNDLDVGYFTRPSGPDSLLRVVAEVSDPIDFFRSHCETAEAFGLEKGLAPKRHGRVEDYIHYRQAIHVEASRYHQEHPYSWGDHLRWYLQWPRREQRG